MFDCTVGYWHDKFRRRFNYIRAQLVRYNNLCSNYECHTRKARYDNTKTNTNYDNDNGFSNNATNCHTIVGPCTNDNGSTIDKSLESIKFNEHVQVHEGRIFR